MADTLYTTTENIRAALGVSPRELSEELMLGLQLDIQLEIDLDMLVPDHALIATAGQAAVDADAVKAWKRLQVIAMYQGALILLMNMQLWSVQKISDGDLDMQRFAANDLQTMINNITDRRNTLVVILNPEFQTTATVQFLSLASPSRDPVIDA